jgi:2-oxo-3-hexenedioate decarboxylase/2-keto-4-pentenoate hydratase
VKPADVERAAEILRDARLRHVPIDPLPADLRPASEREGYLVQVALNRQLTASGRGPIAGHKIGCTTRVMQAYLGLSSPCAGEVFEQTVHRRRTTIRADDFLRVGVECEIAVELGRDLDGPGPFTRASVAPAVNAAMASIEVVEDRYREYATLDAPTLIADDFFNAGIVLGEPVRAWRNLDLGAVLGRMSINGEVVGEGRGSDILGHPLEALAWLATNGAAIGRPLKAGEFVSLGSLVQTNWVTAGDEIRIEIDGLGDASIAFV